MKVRTAHVASWLLTLIGSWLYRLSCRVLGWGDSVEDWAGIGMADLPEGIWIKAEYADSDDFKAGGTD